MQPRFQSEIPDHLGFQIMNMQEREARTEDNLGPSNNPHGILTLMPQWASKKRKRFGFKVLTVTDRFPERGDK
jgi:hypothetical protein